MVNVCIYLFNNIDDVIYMYAYVLYDKSNFLDYEISFIKEEVSDFRLLKIRETDMGIYV